jgi:hypothetical protein
MQRILQRWQRLAFIININIHLIGRDLRAAREANSSHSEIGGDKPCSQHLSD